jgi:hypothetical protein
MKTTLNVRDDLYRRAKAQAALQGKTLGRFLEESLERMLEGHTTESGFWMQWAASLPSVSESAVRELRSVTASEEFRSVDPEMWP